MAREKNGYVDFSITLPKELFELMEVERKSKFKHRSEFVTDLVVRYFEAN